MFGVSLILGKLNINVKNIGITNPDFRIHMCHHFRFSIVFTSSSASDAKSSASFWSCSVRLLIF